MISVGAGAVKSTNIAIMNQTRGTSPVFGVPLAGNLSEKVDRGEFTS